MIQKALPQDHRLLTELTKVSKNHWNYGEEQIKLWNADLTIGPAYIEQNIVYKLVHNEVLLAYYSLLQLPENILKLDNLFVHPDAIGQGWGKLLMEDIFAKAKKMEASKITLDADPHAETFYLHLGFKTVGKTATSIPGRFLPVMDFLLF